MGLDISIYRVTAPEGIAPGDRISSDIKEEKYKNTEFKEINDDSLCDTVRRIGVRCFIDNTYVVYEDIILDTIIKLGIKENKAKEFAEEAKLSVTVNRDDTESRIFKVSNHLTKKVLSGMPIFGSMKESVSADLENTGDYTVTGQVMKNNTLVVDIKKLTDSSKPYSGRYSREKQEEVYAFDIEQLAYQRNELNDRGWELLPDPDNEPGLLDDKERVRLMTEEGGLSKEFIEKWEDGQTIFDAWW